ncbi:MAG: nuclear transport factor 2 family protein [Cyclobacteriaceae bacterium]
MKMAVLVLLLAGLLTGCDQKNPEKKTSDDESVALPFEVTYKGTPEIGSMKNVQTVMEWNKRFSQLNFNVGDLLADTVTFHLADGFEMTAPRDSAIAFVTAFAANISQIDVIYTAAVPVNMAGQGHEWVFSWTTETYTSKDSKGEKVFFHEDYRLEGGKIREVFQYARQPPPPAAK